MPQKPKKTPAAPPAAPPVPVDPEKILSVRATAARGPLNYGQLRWQLFHRKANGLDRAILKIGRRTYIDAGRYDEWLATMREVA